MDFNKYLTVEDKTTKHPKRWQIVYNIEKRQDDIDEIVKLFGTESPSKISVILAGVCRDINSGKLQLVTPKGNK